MILEEKIRNYLGDTLSVNVYLEVPKAPPDSYVVIQRTGSIGANRLRTATLAIQSIAQTLCEAAQLNEAVKQALDVVEITDVFGVYLNSDYNFTNTNTKERRYQAVYNITYKE